MNQRFFVSLGMTIKSGEETIVGQALRLPTQPMPLPYKKLVQKMLNRRINSWRASIACAGFIRLSTFSRRSRSIAASWRTSWLRAFHFAYLPAPMPSARSAETIQTVMSVVVTRSISVENLTFLLHNKVQAARWGARAPRPPFSATPPKSLSTPRGARHSG